MKLIGFRINLAIMLLGRVQELHKQVVRLVCLLKFDDDYGYYEVSFRDGSVHVGEWRLFPSSDPVYCLSSFP